MKRSEMLEAIKGDLARMDLDYLHGRNLDKTTYHQRVEMLTRYFLLLAERYGMLPPRTDTRECGHCLNDALENCVWEPEDEA